MFHYVNNVLGVDGNRRAYALLDWQVEVVLPGLDTVVPIYSTDDEASPIVAVSGVVNRALADEFGNVDFWIEPGNYDLKYYTAIGEFSRRVAGLDLYGIDASGAESVAAAALSIEAKEGSEAALALAEQAVVDAGAERDGAETARVATEALTTQAGTFRDQAQTIKDQVVAAIAVTPGNLQANLATPTVPPAGVASGSQYWAAITDGIQLYLNTGGTGAPVSPSVIQPNKALVDAIPARKKPTAVGRGLDFIGKRRRRFGGFKDDGTLFDAAQVGLRWVSAAKVRLERLGGGAFVDLNSDGSVGVAGEVRRPSSSSEYVTAYIGRRRRLLAGLRKTGIGLDGILGNALLHTTATGFELKGANGTPVATLDGTTVTLYGGSGGTPTPTPTSSVSSLRYPIQPLATSASPANAQPAAMWPHPSSYMQYAYADKARLEGIGSSSIERFDAWLTSLGSSNGFTTVVNNGKGSDQAEHILARIGVRPALLALPGNVIPADTGLVNITASNMPFRDGFKNTFGTLAGVPGRIASAVGSTTLIFQRTTAGSAVAITPDTPFMPDTTWQDRSAFKLVMFGKNSFGILTPTVLLDETQEIFNMSAPYEKRMLVIDHFVNPSGSNLADIVAYNTGAASRWGSLVVQQYAFLCKGTVLYGQDVWTLTGLTPTTEDLAFQAIGKLPRSLAEDNDITKVHTNDYGYIALAWLIQRKFDELRWFA